MAQPAAQEMELDDTEKALLNAFRDIRRSGQTASEWRTLGKFAHSKALEEEREYEARMMTVEGQLCLRVRIYHQSTVDRIYEVYDKHFPPEPGCRRVLRPARRPHRIVENLAFEMMMKGLEAMEQELALGSSE